jgi:hypothetical protein
MAEAMVSFPDELLERIDRDARARRLERLLATPGHFGGRGAEEVRRDRSR